MKSLLRRARRAAKYALNAAVFALPANARQRYKEFHELRYWKRVAHPSRVNAEQFAKARAHYEYFFTEFFGLTRSDYTGKRILDIGCGPRGSLEWADVAKERVGLDPLADKYRQLREDKQQMTYCRAHSEAIPYADGYFDVVTSFNSLDHVDNIDATIREMKRVTAPDGIILLIVEIDHAPTPTEPHALDRSIVEKFAPFTADNVRLFGMRDDHGMYQSLREGVPHVPGKAAILAARLTRG